MDSVPLSVDLVTLVSRVLSERLTPVSEIADVIVAIRRGAEATAHPPALPSKESAPVALPIRQRKSPAKIKRKVRSKRETSRPASLHEPIEVMLVEERAPPRLLRRADVVSHETAPDPTNGLLRQEPISIRSLRGVVKWFDPQGRKGAVRVAGISADLAVNGELLEKSGINRLYKDQEVEARVESRDNGPYVLGLSLPSRIQSNTSAFKISSGGPSTVVKPRQPNGVSVQIKTDISRQKKAREAAETLLGRVPSANKLG